MTICLRIEIVKRIPVVTKGWYWYGSGEKFGRGRMREKHLMTQFEEEKKIQCFGSEQCFGSA